MNETKRAEDISELGGPVAIPQLEKLGFIHQRWAMNFVPRAEWIDAKRPWREGGGEEEERRRMVRTAATRTKTETEMDLGLTQLSQPPPDETAAIPGPGRGTGMDGACEEADLSLPDCEGIGNASVSKLAMVERERRRGPARLTVYYGKSGESEKDGKDESVLHSPLRMTPVKRD